MKTDVSGRIFFNPRALAGFVLFCAILAGLIALNSSWIGMISALIYLAALAVGSLVIIVRNLRRRPGIDRAHLGQAAALPRSWRKWVLDEDAGKKD